MCALAQGRKGECVADTFDNDFLAGPPNTIEASGLSRREGDLQRRRGCRGRRDEDSLR